MKKIPRIAFSLLVSFGVLALALTVLTSCFSQGRSQTGPSDPDRETGEQNPPPQRSDILNNYHKAIEALSVMPQDMPVEFPIGTNSPIPIGQISEDTGKPGENRDSEIYVIGFVSNDGKPQKITPGNLTVMFETIRNKGGTLPSIDMTPKAQENLLANAKDRKRIPVLDLIIRGKAASNQKYVVRNVNANAVNRDALNAVLNGTLRRSNDK
ncbi:MAG: hypothetical protein EA000_13170 [Oscillatoriales cyanobacterium]|uniref:hypothetical protein n=1 Tax=Microcoleus anatoxicus TaxID=2705319 RepID=UPI0029832B84|nr:MAG: hypothetical protein EA000_13170 [Oscillatoriales cyanobacterium]